MARLFGIAAPLPNFPARYNVAPTQEIPIIRNIAGVSELVSLRWGLVPSWSKNGPSSKPLINARCETVYEKPSFRAAIRRRRCLLPADGFYEWHRPEDGPKTPLNICRQDGELFAMAGLWETWMAPDGSELESCALITTHANDLMKPIHHRMPVILDPAEWQAWLSTEEDQADTLKSLMMPAPDGVLRAYPVSDKVNKIANQGPDLINPADEEPVLAKPDTSNQGTLF